MRVEKMIKGSVTVRAQGTQLSRFLSLLLARNILYQNAQYQGGDLLLDLPAKEYRQAVSCAKKAGVRIRIDARRGLPFLFFRHRRRKWMLLILLPLLAAIVWVPRYIWRIEIEGLEEITQLEMLRRLEEAGVHEGMEKNEIDSLAVKDEILLAYPDLSWLSVSVEGSVLRVRAAEAVLPPEMVDRLSPCDIVAQERCVIYSVVTEGGTPQVKQGDVVEQGDVLIRGEVVLKDDDGNESIQAAHAAGVVFGKRQCRLEEEMSYAYEEPIWEETSYHGFLVRLGGRKLELKNPFRQQAEREAMTETTILRLPFFSGFSLSHLVHEPYTLQEKTYTREEAELKLQERLEKRRAALLQEGNQVVLEEEQFFEETEDGLKGVLEITLMEEIGEQVQR